MKALIAHEMAHYKVAYQLFEMDVCFITYTKKVGGFQYTRSGDVEEKTTDGLVKHTLVTMAGLIHDWREIFPLTCLENDFSSWCSIKDLFLVDASELEEEGTDAYRVHQYLGEDAAEWKRYAVECIRLLDNDIELPDLQVIPR